MSEKVELAKENARGFVMNFIKRGLLGITRKKGKSLILLAVIFILGNIMSGAISIQQATGNVEETIKTRLGAAATVEIDYEAFENLGESEQMNFEFENLGVDLIKQIGETSYVKYYDYNVEGYLESKTVKNYYDWETDEDVLVDDDYGAHFTLKGINYAPVLDFEEEKGKLTDGRVFTQDEIDNGTPVTIISKKLAEKNNLHVGDTFVLENVIHNYDYENDKELDPITRDVVLEVIGLFEQQKVKEDTDEDEQNGMWTGIDDDYLNTMYVPNELVLAENKFELESYAESDPEFAAMLEENPEEFEYYQPMYILNNPEDVEAFEQEITPLLPELYKVSSATEQYDNIAGPIQSMSKLAKYVLIVAVVATVFITGLVVLLFLRDRKRELGIYLSLGEKRGRVVGQILIEVMVVAFIGISLSLFSGNLLAGQVSDTLMKADDDSSSYQDDFMYYGGGIQIDLTEDDVVGAYEVGLTSSYVIVFYGVGLLTILLSTVIPLVYIVRLNPKKILM